MLCDLLASVPGDVQAYDPRLGNPVAATLSASRAQEALPRFVESDERLEVRLPIPTAASWASPCSRHSCARLQSTVDATGIIAEAIDYVVNLVGGLSRNRHRFEITTRRSSTGSRWTTGLRTQARGSTKFQIQRRQRIGELPQRSTRGDAARGMAGRKIRKIMGESSCTGARGVQGS